MNDTTNEWWGDWIPGEYAPFPEDLDDDNGDDVGTGENNGDSSSGDSNTGTPGFESILLFTALIAVIFILRRRR